MLPVSNSGFYTGVLPLNYNHLSDGTMNDNTMSACKCKYDCVLVEYVNLKVLTNNLRGAPPQGPFFINILYSILTVH